METTTTPLPTPVGLFARKVAKVTGLSELALDRLHTSDMGSPRHFCYIGGTEGGFFYTVDGLSRLVEILHADGYKAEAVMLSRALDELRQPPTPPKAPAGINVRGGWMASHEARQDAAA